MRSDPKGLGNPSGLAFCGALQSRHVIADMRGNLWHAHCDAGGLAAGFDRHVVLPIWQRAERAVELALQQLCPERLMMRHPINRAAVREEGERDQREVAQMHGRVAQERPIEGDKIEDEYEKQYRDEQ